jgi:DHA2 family multidrug resistance protein
MPGGFVIMALLPVVGRLVNIVQPRYLIAGGLIGMSAAMYYMTNFDMQISFGTLVMARCFQTASMAFLFVPINTIAYAGLPPGKSNSASALINLMRNLGGSVGISAVTTMLARRGQFHQNRLVGHVSPYDPAYQSAISKAIENLIHHGALPGEAMQRALASIYQTLQQQAQMLSYVDTFKMLSVAALVMSITTIFLKRMNLGEAAAQGGH